jgi:hypothetical protein
MFYISWNGGKWLFEVAVTIGKDATTTAHGSICVVYLTCIAKISWFWYKRHFSKSSKLFYRYTPQVVVEMLRLCHYHFEPRGSCVE